MKAEVSLEDTIKALTYSAKGLGYARSRILIDSGTQEGLLTYYAPAPEEWEKITKEAPHGFIEIPEIQKPDITLSISNGYVTGACTEWPPEAIRGNRGGSILSAINFNDAEQPDVFANAITTYAQTVFYQDGPYMLDDSRVKIEQWGMFSKLADAYRRPDAVLETLADLSKRETVADLVIEYMRDEGDAFDETETAELFNPYIAFNSPLGKIFVDPQPGFEDISVPDLNIETSGKLTYSHNYEVNCLEKSDGKLSVKIYNKCESITIRFPESFRTSDIAKVECLIRETSAPPILPIGLTNLADVERVKESYSYDSV